MKCDNCPALATEGYEYPESYCAAGVPDNGKMATGGGCKYSISVIRKRMERIDRQKERQYDGILEYYQEREGLERAMRSALRKEIVEADYKHIALARKSDRNDGKLYDQTEYIINGELPMELVWAYEEAEKEVQLSFCRECRWRGKPQKCATCRRNRSMKDNYRAKEQECEALTTKRGETNE